MARVIDIGGQPENDGERRVVRALAEQLPEEYGLLPNIVIRGRRQRRTFEVDCIVTAPHAVYVLETKDYAGEIVGDANQWLHNGRREDSPIALTNHKAKVLKSILREADEPVPGVWVQSYVVFAGKPSRIGLDPDEQAQTVFVDDVAALLQNPTRLPHPTKPIAGLVDRVERILRPISHASSGPSRFGDWDVVERLGVDGEVARYRVRSTVARGTRDATLTVWGLSSYLLTESERRSERARILREFVALQHMGSHQNVIGARAAFEEGDAVCVVVDEPPGVPLSMALRGDDSPTRGSELERLARIDDLAVAVTHAHEHGVVHRRIAPSCVLLDDQGTRLSGFAHARIAREGTIHDDPSSIDEADSPYIAPEVLDPAVGKVGTAADLYSLAAVAVTLWTGAQLSPGQRPDAQLAADMPAALRDVLGGMLEPDLAARRGSVDALRSAISVSRREIETRKGVRPAPERYEPGQLIDDRYEVVEVLGTGAFATVYRARDRVAGTEHTVKVLRDEAGLEPARREVAALWPIDHPHVVRVAGVHQTATVPPRWYVLSRYAPGEPLTRHIRSEALLSVPEALAIADQLLAACEAFHPAPGTLMGLVHRDIKPANVIFDHSTQHATLIDFNIATPAGSAIHTSSGSPGYQPPNADLETWSLDADLYAVGVVLCELLTGQHPYPGRQPVPSPPQRASDLRPEVPPAVSEVIVQACAWDREDRFSSATEMREALAAAIAPPDEPHAPMPQTTSVAVEAADPLPATVLDRSVPELADVDTVVGKGVTSSGSGTLPSTQPVGGAARTQHPAPRRRSRVFMVAAVVVVALATAAGIGMAATSGDGGDAYGGNEPPEAEPIGRNCPGDFPVKGNINDEGERIYHVDEGRFYDETWPETCFATPESAEDAGYRASEV